MKPDWMPENPYKPDLRIEQTINALLCDGHIVFNHGSIAGAKAATKKIEWVLRLKPSEALRVCEQMLKELEEMK